MPLLRTPNINYLENIFLIIAVNNEKPAKTRKIINGTAIHIPTVLNTQKSAIVKSKGTGHELTFITRACA